MMRVMTVKEVADFLRLKEPTVCRLASDGKLPGVKVGKSWRFDLEALERLVAGAKAGIIDRMEGKRADEFKEQERRTT